MNLGGPRRIYDFTKYIYYTYIYKHRNKFANIFSIYLGRVVTLNLTYTYMYVYVYIVTTYITYRVY